MLLLTWVNSFRALTGQQLLGKTGGETIHPWRTSHKCQSLFIQLHICTCLGQLECCCCSCSGSSSNSRLQKCQGWSRARMFWALEQTFLRNLRSWAKTREKKTTICIARKLDSARDYWWQWLPEPGARWQCSWRSCSGPLVMDTLCSGRDDPVSHMHCTNGRGEGLLLSGLCSCHTR